MHICICTCINIYLFIYLHIHILYISLAHSSHSLTHPHALTDSSLTHLFKTPHLFFSAGVAFVSACTRSAPPLSVYAMYSSARRYRFADAFLSAASCKKPSATLSNAAASFLGISRCDCTRLPVPSRISTPPEGIATKASGDL